MSTMTQLQAVAAMSEPIDQYTMIERAGALAHRVGIPLTRNPYRLLSPQIERTRGGDSFVPNDAGPTINPMFVWAWGWHDASIERVVDSRALRR